MAITLQDQIKTSGETAVDYKLEFRTWNGSAYVWTDYSDRLVDFSGIGAQVEQAALPNAFRMQFGSVTLDNFDGRLTDIDALDGLLYNASEPYGKSVYKRMLRVSDVRYINGTLTTTILGTALVRDWKLDSHSQTIVVDTITLDARASDQQCDSDKCNRHPLGGTSDSTPASWTKTRPASLTAQIAMYRWREPGYSNSGDLSYDWFRNKRAVDVVERTAWALDDLATDIDKDTFLYTADDRRIATTRNRPPDDDDVTGRTRAVVWNPERNVLVCCIDNLVYDYDPATNVYTLRNTLDATHMIARAWYITTPDDAARTRRIVLLQYDVANYLNSKHVAQTWITVLYDATGAGAYTVVCEGQLATDTFPGTHQVRPGGFDSPSYYVGAGVDYFGENIFIPFRQRVDRVLHEDGFARYSTVNNGLWDKILSPDYEGSYVPFTADPKYYAAATVGTPTHPLDLRWSWGSRFAACICLYQTGGRLHFFTWDASNGYRMKWLSLYDYTTTAYVALNGANTHVPYFLSAHPSTNPHFVFVCQMEWKDTKNAAPDYSVCHVNYYNWATPGWTAITWLSGATGSDQAWTAMEVQLLSLSPTSKIVASLWNRETGKWRLCSDLGASWGATNTNCLNGYLNVAKDQDNGLEGLFENPNYSPRRIFFVESGPNYLWSYDGSLLRAENLTPSDTTMPPPINTDIRIGALMTTTQANYPTSDTPEGVMFWVSENDYGDASVFSPAGEYVLCQHANFNAGFIKLVDLSGMSFWEAQTKIAEKHEYLHFYEPDGTLAFKPRETSGAVDFVFSAANGNYLKAAIKSRGFESIINDVTVYPYDVKIDARVSDIVKTKGDADSTGVMDDVSVSPDPGETAYWKIIFTTPTTYDLYKLQGAGGSSTVPAVAAHSLDLPLRDIPNGAYLTILPEHFAGSFVRNDSFSFWVLEPQLSLEKLDDGDMVRLPDATSIAAYQRTANEYDNRFIDKQTAPDFGAAVLTWHAARHDVIELTAVFDPAYALLKRCSLLNSGLGCDSWTFQIMGISHNKRDACILTLVKI